MNKQVMEICSILLKEGYSKLEIVGAVEKALGIAHVKGVYISATDEIETYTTGSGTVILL